MKNNNAMNKVFNFFSFKKITANKLKINVSNHLDNADLPSTELLFHVISTANLISPFNQIDVSQNQLNTSKKVLELLVKASLNLPEIEILDLSKNNLDINDYTLIKNFVVNQKGLTSLKKVDLSFNKIDILNKSPNFTLRHNNCKFDISYQSPVVCSPKGEMVFKQVQPLPISLSESKSVKTKKISVSN
jgi:hypothetical protein